MMDIASFRFADPGEAFDRGYQRVNALRSDFAERQAGNALMGGDYEGAAARLYGAGDLRGGMALQQESRQQAQARQEAEARQAAMQRRMSVGGKIAGGDYGAARDEAVMAGDFDLAASVAKMDEAQQAQFKAQSERLASALLPLRSMPYEQRKAYLAAQRGRLADLWPALEGIDPTDQNIDLEVGQALGVGKLLEEENRRRDDERAERQLQETERRNRATEANAAANTGLRREAGARAAAKGSGGSGLAGIEAALRKRGLIQ